MITLGTHANSHGHTYIEFHYCMGSRARAVVQGLYQNLLNLSGQTCNTIYQNFDKAHVFCNSLFFQRAPMDVCMSNRSQVTASFVKTVLCTYLKNKQNKKWTKKWEEHSTFESIGSVKGKMSASCAIKKYTASEKSLYGKQCCITQHCIL